MSAIDYVNTIQLTAPRVELIPSLKEAVEEAFQSRISIQRYRFGFYRVPLVTSRYEPGKYLHVWDASLYRDEFPHRHSWRMRSRVLMGSLTNTLWNLIDDPEGTHGVYRTMYLNEGRETDAEFVRGPIRPEKLSAETVPEDSLYTMDSESFHTTELHDPIVITLMEKSDIDI